MGSIHVDETGKCSNEKVAAAIRQGEGIEVINVEPPLQFVLGVVVDPVER